MILGDSECEFSWCKTHYSVNMHWKILFFTSFDYKPIPVAERSKVRVCGRSLAGIAGFESRRGHGCLSHVNVVCCHVEVSAMGWSLVQRSPTDCDVSLCVIQKPQQ
jgi:hypothetical protein